MAVIEKGFCDVIGCNNWPECNYQDGLNPPCVSKTSESPTKSPNTQSTAAIKKLETHSFEIECDDNVFVRLSEVLDCINAIKA